MTYSIYVEYAQKLELNGEFRSVYPEATSRIVGENSILVLPGGQGHKHHKRLRTKILANLAPKPCLEILPDITAEVRKMLDELADATTKDGFTSFGDPAEHMAAKVSALQITAGLSENLQLRVERLTDTAMEGLMAFPIDFGRYTAFGRAMQARKELKQIIDQQQANLVFDKRNILADLVTSSQSGEQFSTDEVVDTIITLLVAGKMTTADVLPHVFVKLSQQQEWAAKVAQEKLEFNSIEEDSAALRVVLECIRLNPPLGGVGRIRSTALDLGTHGRIPPNCPFAYSWRNELRDLGGEDFNPDIWTPDFVRRHGTLAFGGNQPHTCIGRNLALLELQVFARMLCRDYDFRALNTELIVKPNKPIAPAFKDGLRVVVARKP